VAGGGGPEAEGIGPEAGGIEPVSGRFGSCPAGGRRSPERADPALSLPADSGSDRRKRVPIVINSSRTPLIMKKLRGGTSVEKSSRNGAAMRKIDKRYSITT